jgi:hypothetical protein
VIGIRFQVFYLLTIRSPFGHVGKAVARFAQGRGPGFPLLSIRSHVVIMFLYHSRPTGFDEGGL